MDREDLKQRLRIIMDALHFSMVGDGSGDDKEYRLRRINQALENAEVLLKYEADGHYSGELKTADLIDRIKTYREEIEAGCEIIASQKLLSRLTSQIATLVDLGCEKFVWSNIAGTCDKCNGRSNKVFTLEELKKEIINREFCKDGECLVMLFPGGYKNELSTKAE